MSYWQGPYDIVYIFYIELGLFGKNKWLLNAVKTTYLYYGGLFKHLRDQSMSYSDKLKPNWEGVPDI